MEPKFDLPVYGDASVLNFAAEPWKIDFAEICTKKASKASTESKVKTQTREEIAALKAMDHEEMEAERLLQLQYLSLLSMNDGMHLEHRHFGPCSTMYSSGNCSCGYGQSCSDMERFLQKSLAFREPPGLESSEDSANSSPTAGVEPNRSQPTKFNGCKRKGATARAAREQLAARQGQDAQVADDRNAVRPKSTSDVRLTTVMMRNIPNNFNRDFLIELINSAGFSNTYDLVYLPVDFKSRVGLGYAFVNFERHADAEQFRTHFDGFENWSVQSKKVCKVSWSDALQGLEDNIERYRNCPVMHDSVPDEFKPVLFQNGKRIPFPAPTKKFRCPKILKSGSSAKQADENTN